MSLKSRVADLEKRVAELEAELCPFCQKNKLVPFDEVVVNYTNSSGASINIKLTQCDSTPSCCKTCYIESLNYGNYETD